MSTLTPLARRVMRRANMSGKSIILCTTLMLFSVFSRWRMEGHCEPQTCLPAG